MQILISELLYAVSFALDCVEHDLLGAQTNHAKRVACLCFEVGGRLGLGARQLSDLACCAVLHDNALTEYILSERRGGDAGERKINLKVHCELGEENARSFPFFGDVSGYILYHHENADGSGGFGRGEGEIPLGAAIIRLADNVDVLYDLSALTQPKLRHIRRHVRENTGRLYAPPVAEAFLDYCGESTLLPLDNLHIDAVLRSHTPRVPMDCSNAQLVRLADVFSKIIDYKSPFTRRHSAGIAQKASILAAGYGAGEEERAQLYLAAALHDVGKLAVPTAILEKPQNLTDEEYRIIQKHVLYTHQMLSRVPGFEIIDRWASNHHEKLNGGGYPFGLKAGELDFNSRLMACVDIYQALSEDRPYRAGLSHDAAMKILCSMAGKGLLDAGIVRDIDARAAQFPAVPASMPAPCAACAL